MPGARATEGERREQILAAAYRVAVRDGLEPLTMQAVAREAGVSKGLLFFHYGSKDALLLALLEAQVDWLLALPGAAGPGEDDPPPAVRLLGQLAGEAGYRPENRERIDLLLQYVVLAVRREPLHERAAQGLRTYRDVLRGPAEDLLRAAGLPAGEAQRSADGIAALAAAVVIGTALQSFVDGSFSSATVVAGLRTLVELPARPEVDGGG